VEIAPRVHAVKGLGATVYVICEDEVTLIDAGLQGNRRRIDRYLRAIGRSIDDVRRIVCTHAHPDHIGAVRELARDPAVEVLMHAADIERLRISLREVLRRPTTSPIIALLTRGPEDARPLQDGEVLPALSGLHVVHTPGHTPGSICLYAPAHRLLFVGDVLQVIRGRLSFASVFFSEDAPLSRRSIGRLAELDVETICFAHYPPWRDGAREALARLAEAA
jgi:glyoxylase-like metal-dependent hydrolase (beta-lactamase superfamily II)